MSPNPEADRSQTYASAPKRRRRYTVWTLLAPAAVVVLWIAFFSALGQSCVFKECVDKKGAAAKTAAGGDKQNEVPRGGKAKVKAGDSIGSIAARFDLSEDELKACNPLVDPQSLQPGQFLLVSAIDCEGADQAANGANPDPLAGDTTAGAASTAPDPAENGTAAADPSAQSADAGDDPTNIDPSSPG